MPQKRFTLAVATKFFSAVLAIIFFGEAFVMYLLPYVLPSDVDHNIEAFCDAGLLTLITMSVSA